MKKDWKKFWFGYDSKNEKHVNTLTKFKNTCRKSKDCISQTTIRIVEKIPHAIKLIGGGISTTLDFIQNFLKTFSDCIPKSYSSRCREWLRQNNNQSVDFSEVYPSPIRLTSNEKLFGVYHNVKMGTYKANGKMSYTGLGVKVRLAKGVYIGSARGKATRDKSWIFDEVGTLYITSKGLQFDGTTSNVMIAYNKTVNIGCDGKHMYVDKTQGKDVCFKVNKHEFSPEHAMLVYGYSTGQITN